jgi:hypothetical protein
VWAGRFEVMTMLEYSQKNHHFTYFILCINLFLVWPKYLSHLIRSRKERKKKKKELHVKADICSHRALGIAWIPECGI